MYGLRTAYIVMCSVQVPFNIVYILLFWRHAGEQAAAEALGGLYPVIAFVYYLVLFSIGITIVVKSIGMTETDVREKAPQLWFSLKIGMIPFFVVNFLSIAAMLLLLTVASRGIFIFGVLLTIPFLAGATWAAMLPGSIIGVRAIRALIADGVMPSKHCMLHLVAQFIFCADVLDCAYITAIYRKRNRLLCGIVSVLYLAAAIAVAAVCVMVVRVWI